MKTFQVARNKTSLLLERLSQLDVDRDLINSLVDHVLSFDRECILLKAQLDGQVPSLLEAVQENLQRALKAEERVKHLEILVETLQGKIAALSGLRDEIERVIHSAFAAATACDTCYGVGGDGGDKCGSCGGSGMSSAGVQEATRGVMDIISTIYSSNTG